MEVDELLAAVEVPVGLTLPAAEVAGFETAVAVEMPVAEPVLEMLAWADAAPQMESFWDLAPNAPGSLGQSL